MKHFRAGLVLLVCLALVAMAPMALAGPGKGAQQAPEVDLQILAFNDFHGQIQPYVSTSNGGYVSGGAAFLATFMRDLEATTRNTVIISGGDLVGASPLVSALFHDEPTIEAANLMGVDFATIGNHEFDEGWPELIRMQEGGCHPVDGCLDGDPFYGAEFPFLSANVVRDDTGDTLFAPYEVKTFQGVRVAFIGAVLEGTPSIVTASGVEGLTFLDEAEAINASVAELKKRNIKAIVAVVHEGGGWGCSGGSIVDVVEATDEEVDLFITGHTHATYVCDIDGRTVTSTRNAGRALSEIDLTLNRVTKDITSINAVNHDMNHALIPDVEPAADVQALIDKYQVLSAPLANQVIGSITTDITRTANAAGESALGDVIADAQLAETAPVGKGEAVAAFMNRGGIRTELLYGQISGGEALGEVTYGEAFAVQPFTNYLITMTLTGTQIDELLEQQFPTADPDDWSILQVSDGFSYTWDASDPVGSKVDPASIVIDGGSIALGASYRVTVNSFLADGGDGFTVLAEGTDRLTGAIDLDSFVAYFGDNSPVPPGPQTRITMVP